MNTFIQKQQNQKSKLTQALVDLLPHDKSCASEEARVLWWFNIRESGGYRLTDIGFDALKNDLELETWSVDTSKNNNAVNQRILLSLDKSLNWPYYIDVKKKQIHFFSSKEATVAVLHGDVFSWMEKVN